MGHHYMAGCHSHYGIWLLHGLPARFVGIRLDDGKARFDHGFVGISYHESYSIQAIATKRGFLDVHTIEVVE